MSQDSVIHAWLVSARINIKWAQAVQAKLELSLRDLFWIDLKANYTFLFPVDIWSQYHQKEINFKRKLLITIANIILWQFKIEIICNGFIEYD